jgi:transcriptional regulator with XRE-family HTH domain
MSEISKIEQYVIDKVREIRMKAEISQSNLSAGMELSSKFVGNVESSKTPDKYNINHLNKIAEILQCSIKDFFPDKPIPGDILKKKSNSK